MMAKMARELAAWIEAAVVAAPGGTGYRLRAWWFSRRVASLGKGAVLGPRLSVVGPDRLRIGEGFSCWAGCVLAPCDGTITIGRHVSFNLGVCVNSGSGGTVEIGDNSMIGPYAVLRSSNHEFGDPSRLMRTQGHNAGHIVLEEDVWLGAHVTVAGTVTIGRGAVVAAGAVVVRDVAPYTVVGGVPARLIRSRLPAENAGPETDS